MGISIWQLLIILLIAIVLFGTKKLRNIGGDLGAAIKNFRQSVRDGEEDTAKSTKENLNQDADEKSTVIEGKVTDKQNTKV